jgi:hypothetical protein
MINQAKGGGSLAIVVPEKNTQTGKLVNVARGAVTGNVFGGKPLPPDRTIQSPPLPPWVDYNHVLS